MMEIRKRDSTKGNKRSTKPEKQKSRTRKSDCGNEQSKGEMALILS
jgi:hypothetical protein